MNKAVFLDRDGVINRKGGPYYIFRQKDFVFNEGIIEALKYFISRNYILIVITNQGGISKGCFTQTDLEKLHSYMFDILRQNGIILTELLYCPHHPDNESCRCRKPGTMLFELAITKHYINPGESYMIGDSEIDILAAEKLGINGILIPSNENIMEFVVNSGKL